jgi:type VI secretion system protein ImpA
LALSLAALARLQASVDSRISDGPAFMPAREALQDTLHLARRLIRERGLAEPGSAPTTMPVDTADNMGIDPAAAVTASDGTLQNRAQALEQLREVAAFFRRTEPHSPVAYLADKAAHWGDLPLHLWLRAVLKDQAMLSQLDDLLGVVPPKQE